MQIIPLKELKDCSRISEMCHATDEPIHITKNGYSDMVIMSSETYDRMAIASHRAQVAAAIHEGIAAIERGEYRDAFAALASTRQKYGI